VSFGDLFSLLRPSQWIKNVVVFAGPAAGLRLADADGLVHAVIAFVAFCLAASATYAINDVLDRQADAKHPTKRNRPVARGAIRPSLATGMGIALIATALTLTALTLEPAVTFVLAAYFAMTLAYSVDLKKRVLLDVIVIASGFVLRAWAGSLAVGVPTSEWLVACMFTLCLFMGFGKRRCEITMIGNNVDAGKHRHTLIRYTPALLNHLISVSAGIAVMTFLLYTLEAGTDGAFPKTQLFYTLPVVVYGVFRFAMLTESGQYSGPTEIILKDRAMLATICGWTVLALAIAYQKSILGPQGWERVFGGW